MEALTRTSVETGTTGLFNWAAASSAFPGESESGDLFVVLSSSEGDLIAVIDGLGHGPEAAAAASTAAAVLREERTQSLEQAFRRCHHMLQGTRGVAMSVAALDSRTSSMAWLSVGNVEAVLLRANSGNSHAREWLVLRGGVVGYELPPLKTVHVSLSPGDVLMLATDGISHGFVDDTRILEPVAYCARRVMARHRRPADDALVLVARYGGAP